MGLFHPARTVKGPSGQEWELYVSQLTMPAWKEGGYNSAVDDVDVARLEAGMLGLLAIPFMFVALLWSTVIVPVLRFFLVLPFAYIKGKRSHAVRIEAISYFPHRETMLWTTTSDQVESVLDHIAAGLAEGKVVQVAGAVYSGTHDG